MRSIHTESRCWPAATSICKFSAESTIIRGRMQPYWGRETSGSRFARLGVVGNYLLNGNTSINPTLKTGMVPVSDPLAYLTKPAVGACNFNNTVYNGTVTATLNPGVYCGGLTI